MITRPLTINGEAWVAWLSGGGAVGTGVCGPGNIEAVHFGRADAPEVPLFEGLLPAGTFFGLFDEELAEAFRQAKPIVAADDQGGRRARRPRSLE